MRVDAGWRKHAAHLLWHHKKTCVLGSMAKQLNKIT